MTKFICPIPWISLSLGAKSSPRVCCHQSEGLKLQDANLLLLEHVKEVREEMLAGKVPSACRGCFELEQEGCQSPRGDYINRYGIGPQDLKVRYLDVTLNNDCNLECLMCSPVYSYKLNNLYHRTLGHQLESSWQTELTGEMLKSLLPTLEVITLTGGEPLVAKKSLDFIKFIAVSEFVKNITLRIYTNLSRINLETIKLLSSFKKVELLLSIDSVGENYELIRYPAKWDQLRNNIQFLNANRFSHLDVHLHAMLMSTNWNFIGDLIEFYQDELAQPNHLPIFVEIETPSFLHPGVLPEDQFNEGLEKLEASLKRLEQKKPQALTEINEFRKLIQKVSKKRNPNLFLQYRIFLSKLNETRRVNE